MDEGLLDVFENDNDRVPASWRTGSVGRIGTTSYIGNAECLNQPMAEFCQRLRSDFQWDHTELALVRNRESGSWVTSGPHFDQVDNFVTQLWGAKQWKLWSTANLTSHELRRRVLRTPGYGEVATPVDGSNVVDVTVEPGDLLYLPVYWGHAVRPAGPGLMLSISLKALLPSQALLAGIERSLGDLETSHDPLPLPVEEHSQERVEAAMRLGAAEVHRALECPSRAGFELSTLAQTGVAATASRRHAVLLRQNTVGESTSEPMHMASVDHSISTTGLSIGEVSHPAASQDGSIVDAFALVHIQRFLALLALGPREWWMASDRAQWTECRDSVDQMDLSQLLKAAPNATMVEATSRFRADLLAFNRRHAVTSLQSWIEAARSCGRTVANTTELSVWRDALATIPAEVNFVNQVHQAIEKIEAVMPGFHASISRIATGVSAVATSEQARLAAGRAGIAVVQSDWDVDDISVALVGERARLSVDLLERIGVVPPGPPSPYTGSWNGTNTDFGRIAAQIAIARYNLSIGNAFHRSPSLRALIAELDASRSIPQGLTLLGKELVEYLERSAKEPDGRPADTQILVSDILADLEEFTGPDSRELVTGHTRQYARFRWSELGTPSPISVEVVGTTGLDCAKPPWMLL
ncbi:JmjC domain-containing protein [Microlunatus speluncae]|uniref:JmjC domain-containing protein n=1 Tax=Microlunatus speluncae TaxID=2594267 RepID=UPI0031B60A43